MSERMIKNMSGMSDDIAMFERSSKRMFGSGCRKHVQKYVNCQLECQPEVGVT